MKIKIVPIGGGMLSPIASELHFSSLVFDTHSDSLGRTVDYREDFGTDTGKGHMDIPRMLAGNQRTQFFAAYVDPVRFSVGEAKYASDTTRENWT